MELNEAKKILKNAGFILEDTDDWDEADMPAGMSDKDREEMAKSIMIEEQTQNLKLIIS